MRTATGTHERAAPAFTPYHGQYLAHRLTLAGVDDDALARSVATARVDMNPHQVDAALFALARPLAKGVLLADEVGLGKTIEAGLVLAQQWAEKRRRVLLVVPAALRKQWTIELQEKFGLPSVILEARSHRERARAGEPPFEVRDRVVVTSYEFAAKRADELAPIPWDLVVFDEAHRLRNVHRGPDTSRAARLKGALGGRFKVLLTATPLQNTVMELFGLVSVIDDEVFGDEASFRELYGGKPDRAALASLRERLKPFYRRTLRRVVQEAGHISYTRRQPATFRFEPTDAETKLYELVSEFLTRPDTVYLGGKLNPLVAMSLRKILGSSSHAIGPTLAAVAERLRRLEEVTLGDLADLDAIEDTAEEWGEGEPKDPTAKDPTVKDPTARTPPSPERIAAEALEVEAFRDLALSITTNAKGEMLARQLPGLLDAIEAKGGRRKAVVFTKSVRTQRYLADLLGRHGFAGRIALLNGANADPESAAVHAAWAARHRGTARVSGSRTADMKAAIVEAFRDDKARRSWPSPPSARRSWPSSCAASCARTSSRRPPSTPPASAPASAC